MTLKELCSQAYYKNKQGMLLNMDCIETMKLMDDECVDLTVTSPPYDNLRTYNGIIAQWSFEKFQAVAKELYRVTKQGGVVVWVVGDATVKGSETGTSFKQALYFMECGFNLHDTMIWEKTARIPTQDRYYNVFEYMFVFSKGKPNAMNFITDHKNVSEGAVRKKDKCINKGHNEKGEGKIVTGEFSRRTNIWKVHICKNLETGNHPAPFPEQLANDHIVSWSNAGDIVFDPFMGSGTTAKMSMVNNRRWLGCEISQEYCDITKQRLNDLKENNK